MRRKIPVPLLAAALLLSGATAAQQAPDTAAMVEEANRKLDEWIDKTRAFVGDVRIEAGDIESFIEHYEEFSSLGEEIGEHDEMVDYDEVLADPRYRSWAAANGLAAEPWLKKSMRIVAFTMRDQMQAGFAQAEAQLPEQRRMIEEQCAQVDAATCAQMKASLEASVAMFDHQRKRLGDLLQPTAGEQELLERYHGALTALMASGDEEWEEVEEEWQDEDEEEWNER